MKLFAMFHLDFRFQPNNPVLHKSIQEIHSPNLSKFIWIHQIKKLQFKCSFVLKKPLQENLNFSTVFEKVLQLLKFNLQHLKFPKFSLRSVTSLFNFHLLLQLPPHEKKNFFTSLTLNFFSCNFHCAINFPVHSISLFMCYYYNEIKRKERKLIEKSSTGLIN